MDQIVTYNRRISRRAWPSLRDAIACMLFLMVAGPNASATSPCYQWQARFGNQISSWGTNVSSLVSDVVAGCHNNFECADCQISSLSCTYTVLTQPMVTTYPDYDQGGVGLTEVFSDGSSYNWNGRSVAGIVIEWRDNPAGCQCYVAGDTPRATQCGPTCNPVNDPINPASGAVFDTEVDEPSTSGSLSFKRFYNSTDSGGADVSGGWRHSFDRSLTPVYSSSSYKTYVASAGTSSLYSDEATACTSGFAQIKSRVSTWSSATATYSNGACVIRVGTQTMATLPILYTSPPTAAPGSTVLIGYDVTRDDGQLVSFTVNGASIAPPPGISLQLQVTGSGYTLTDFNDSVETYDSTGKLLSVATRAGVVQTMSYDSTGRLSGVTDSFGHRLSLSYDSQGRLLSVTRQ